MKKAVSILMCLCVVFCFDVTANSLSEVENGLFEVANISLDTISASITKSGQKIKCGSTCSIFSGDKVSVRLSLQRFIPDTGWRTIEYWVSPDYKYGTYLFEKFSTDNFTAYSSYRVLAAASVYDPNGNFIESVVSYSRILHT